jgi:hypothetical protein
MEEKEFIEHYRFLINRFDQYYNGISAKVGIYWGITAVIIGGLIALYTNDKANSEFFKECESRLIISLILIIATLATIFTLLAMHPYLKSGNFKRTKEQNAYRSLIFFKSIIQYSEAVFIEKSSKLSETDMKNDYERQTYQLANGLKHKHTYLGWAGWMVGIEIILCIILIFLKTL